MSPFDEETLDANFSDEIHPSLGEECRLRYALRVAELARMPGVLEIWRQRCRESFEERRKRHDQLEAWKKGRKKSLSKTLGKRSLWVQQSIVVRNPQTGIAEPTIVDGRVSPRFAEGQEPYAEGPLPFSPRHSPSLADCFLVMALLHDADRRDARRINPFSSHQHGLTFYENQLSRLADLRGTDQVTLDDCLARVEADLGATPSPSTEPPSTAGVDWDALLVSPPLTAAEIAERLGQPVDLVRRCLGYFRGQHDYGFIEDPDAGIGEGRFRYKLPDVLSPLQKWVAKRQKKAARKPK